MSIRVKTLLTILIASTLFFVCFIFTSFSLILNGFDSVENIQVQRNVMRAVDALNARIDDISTKVSDWAQWDDSYKYIQDKNKSFVNSNLTNEAFTALKINMIVFVDIKGVVVLSKFVNLETGQEEALPPAMDSYLQKNSTLFLHSSTDSVIKGVIDLPGDDMLIAARPIITSKGQGPIRGTIIFGRYFDKEIRDSLSRVIHVDLSFDDLNDPTTSQAVQPLISESTTTNSISIHPVNDNTITGSTIFNTISHQPAFLITATFNREVHKQGLKSIFSFFIFFGFLSVVFGLTIVLLLDRIVLARLNILNQGVKQIGQEQGTANHIVLHGHDELSELANQINLMVDSLQRSTIQIKQDETKIKEEAQELERKNATLEQSEQTLLKVMTDLEKTKDKIESEKIQDETMLESIGEGLIVTDKNGIVMIINNAAQQMLKYTAQELIGKRLSDELVMSEEDGAQISAKDSILETVLQSGEKQTKVYYFIRKDGTRFPSVITTTAVMINSTITGAISVLRDITKEKEVDKMKSEFISLASHQLRTPLTAVKWFSESLIGKKASFTPDENEYLESIHSSNERMIDLVDSLLNISRIESGRLSVYPKPTDLIEVIHAIQKELEVKLLEKKITITVVAKPENAVIFTDPKLLNHIFMNLLSNSVKYSPEGTTVTVKISKQDESVVIQIEDHGYGIPENEQNRLFQKFFRAENIKNKETDGTGLGLYLVKIITDLLGGKVWFKSAENAGTTFWISLPVAGTTSKEGEVSLN